MSVTSNELIRSWSFVGLTIAHHWLM